MSQLQPYKFEPRKSKQAEKPPRRDKTVNRDFVGRAGSTDWCNCGECGVMKTDAESFCCTESVIFNKIRGSVDCIKHHSSFDQVILNIDVLKTARQAMLVYEKNPHLVELQDATNRTWRFVAYRQFINWANSGESLGKNRRLVIPACVVQEIRETFPETSGAYVGFSATAGQNAEYFD
jgi:hypothetical protein